MTETSQENLLNSKLAERYEPIGTVDKTGHTHTFKVKDRQDGIIKALKIIPVSNPAGIERFLNDAEKVKSDLSYKGIARLLDYGICEDDGVQNGYLVYDLISGRSLYHLLNRQGRIELKEALDIFIQIAAAVNYLHENGLVHLQLSPRKVILTEVDDQIVVRLIDTGIARHLIDQKIDRAEEQKLFPEGVLYFSPEQCSSLPADHRTDIYATGCIMYECLVGLPPFMNKSPYEVTRMHLNEEAKPLRMSRDDLNFPLELDLLVLKSLRKNIGQRQQSMNELYEDLIHARQELAKMPEESPQKKSSGFIPEVVSSIFEDLAELIGMDSALRVKLAAPIILGFVIIFGSVLVGLALHPHQVTIVDRAEKQWEELEDEGEKYVEAGNLPKAEATYLKALQLAEKFGEKDQKRLLITLRKLQDIYINEKRTDKAEETYARINQLMDEDSKQ